LEKILLENPLFQYNLSRNFRKVNKITKAITKERIFELKDDLIFIWQEGAMKEILKH
jgi:hypothetical protein